MSSWQPVFSLTHFVGPVHARAGTVRCNYVGWMIGLDSLTRKDARIPYNLTADTVVRLWILKVSGESVTAEFDSPYNVPLAPSRDKAHAS